MRFGYRQPGADCRSHRLFNQIDFGSFGAVGGVFHGAPFDLRNLRRDTDHHTRANPRLAVMGLAYEVLKHLFGYFKVCDNAILHGSYSDDITGSSTQHVLRISPYCFDLIGNFIDRNY